MTIEEAIKQLDNLRLICFDYFKKDTEALNIAITALKQIRAIDGIIAISNTTIQEDILKYKMIVDIIKGDW